MCTLGVLSTTELTKFKYYVLIMSWGTIKDNLQRENSNDKYKSLTSVKGYFSLYGSTSVKGTVILFGRTTNPTTHEAYSD